MRLPAALSDPSQSSVPILTIALDAGFGSIGPFNRPSQGTYRDDTHRVPARACGYNAQGTVGPLADSGIGKPVAELISRH
jgi:hypothetical protein